MTGGWFDPGPYARGKEHGRRTAEHASHLDHEHRLWLELALMGKTNRDHRAFALGELRGYRQAAGLPEPLYGHKVRPNFKPFPNNLPSGWAHGGD